MALRVAGQNPQVIADALGVQRRTVYIWFSTPEVKAEVDRRLQEVERLVNQQVARDALRGSATDRETAPLPEAG